MTNMLNLFTSERDQYAASSRTHLEKKKDDFDHFVFLPHLIETSRIRNTLSLTFEQL